MYLGGLKMGRGKLTKEEIAFLENNRYVERVNECYIYYTDEFKKLFVSEYKKGLKPVQIFEKAGFPVEIVGTKRIERSAARWKESAGLASHRKVRLTTNEIKKNAKIEAQANVKEKYELELRKKDKKIEQLEAEVELLKKVGKLGRRRCEKKAYGKIDLCMLVEETIKKNDEYTISALCEVVGLARSTFYYYLSQKEIRDEREERDLECEYFVRKAYDAEEYKRRGSRSIKMRLQNDFDICYSRKKIQRIMRKYGIVCPMKRKNPYKGIWKATKEDKVAPNLVNRRFKTGEARKVLLTDITYLKHQDSFSYLSVIIDAQTTEPIAWKLSKNLKMGFVIDTLNQLNLNELANGVIIHSDQGVHYTSKAFRNRLNEMGIIQSMSRRGNCHDNSPCESFFGHMKQETDFDPNWSDEELENEVKKYINYYRYRRYQKGLNGMSPYEYGNTLKVA